MVNVSLPLADGHAGRRGHVRGQVDHLVGRAVVRFGRCRRPAGCSSQFLRKVDDRPVAAGKRVPVQDLGFDPGRGRRAPVVVLHHDRGTLGPGGDDALVADVAEIVVGDVNGGRTIHVERACEHVGGHRVIRAGAEDQAVDADRTTRRAERPAGPDLDLRVLGGSAVASEKGVRRPGHSRALRSPR